LRSLVKSESAWQKTAHSSYTSTELETVSWKPSENCHCPPSCLGGLRTGSEAFALLKDKLREGSVDKEEIPFRARDDILCFEIVYLSLPFAVGSRPHSLFHVKHF